MGARVEITYEFVQAAMQHDSVRAALRARRDVIARRAEAIAADEGVDADVTTSEGTRPKGRPYARVSADAEQEFGSSNTARRRILGRAAEGA